MPLAITGPVASLQMFLTLWVSQSLALLATAHPSQRVPLQAPEVCSPHSLLLHVVWRF